MKRPYCKPRMDTAQVFFRPPWVMRPGNDLILAYWQQRSAEQKELTRQFFNDEHATLAKVEGLDETPHP